MHLRCIAGLVAFVLAPVAAAAATSPPAINWSLTAPQIARSCKSAIATATARIDSIERGRGERTFANTVLPLENAAADANDSTVAQEFLFEVSPDKGIRAASLACNNDLNNALTALTASPTLYRAVAAASQSGSAQNVYQRKLTSLWLVSLKRSGGAISNRKRPEFIRLEQQLNALQNQFGANLGNDATTITITQPQTSGIPADVLASYTRNAEGSYTIPVNESTASFLQYASNEAALKTYYLAYSNRQAGPNTKLLESAIAVRDRLAHLLGYETWADFQLTDKMAATPPRVMAFLHNLDVAILPKARHDIETLRKMKAAETKNPNAVLEPWDISREMYLLKKARYAVDTEAIRQYFPVQHTIDAVLGIYHTLLGVTFSRVANSNAWAPGVLEYRVNDTATGKLIGYTYFDLYPRPGKFDHFANFPLLPARKIDGVMRPPVAAIVGNWPKPGPGEPALLSHDDVVTFFHEFGHDMAALLATAPYETLSEGFREDFIEAPSQMLENFVWQPSVLKEISSNWKTGAPLPKTLIAKMIAARNVDYAYLTTRQILYATVDMTYHSSGPHVDTTAVWAKLSPELTPQRLYPGTHPQASFGHLMAGYDAGYYGYLWSKVYAQDLFTAFAQGGLESPLVGMRYRRDILAPARTYEPDVEVRNFLGRPMNPNAFYEQFGIAPTGDSTTGTPQRKRRKSAPI